MSDDRDWLEKLSLTKDGKVIKDDEKPSNSDAMASRASLKSKAKNSFVVKTDVTQNRSENVLRLMGEGTGLSQKREEEEDLKTGKERNKESEKSKENHCEDTADSIECDRTNTKYITPDDERSCSANLDCCSDSQLPQASADSIRYLSDLLAFVTHKYESEQRRQLDSSGHNAEAKSEIIDNLKDIRKAVHTVELCPGSGVRANRKDLDHIGTTYRKQPQEMIRRLLRLIIGDKQLAKMSALGGGKYAAVPLNVKKAIEDFVELHTSSKFKAELTPKAVNRINLYAGHLGQETKIKNRSYRPGRRLLRKCLLGKSLLGKCLLGKRLLVKRPA